MARNCIFCGQSAGSAEHIFPDWLNDVFAQIDWQPTGTPPQWGRGTQNLITDEHIENVWTANEICSLTVRKVCRECNNGWMATLEGAAKPLLTPMVLGRPTTLTVAEQVTIGTWATKTAMVCEASMSDDRNFSPEDRRIVMTEDRPPGHVRVMAAGLEGLLSPARFGLIRMEVQQGGKRIGDFHLYTLQINMLVLQVMRQDPPAPVATVWNPPARQWVGEVRVFPPTPAETGFYWPPEVSLSPDTLPQFITRTRNPPSLSGP